MKNVKNQWLVLLIMYWINYDRMIINFTFVKTILYIPRNLKLFNNDEMQNDYCYVRNIFHSIL